MAQTASPSDQTNRQAADAQLTPPEERFWQRYSPHAEFPLSSAGSLALHLLVFGLLVLMAWLGAMLFNHSSQSLPVQAVRLAGGGGNPHSEGDGPNNGAAPIEVGDQPQDSAAEDPLPEDIEHPKEIKVKPDPRIKPQFDSPSTRFLQQPDTSSPVFKRLNKVASRIRLTDPEPTAKPSGRGQGGTGSGGGKGDGVGGGIGNGNGVGHGNLTKREKRMIRWVMGFNSQDTRDYLRQLQGLGAILAVPIRETAKGPVYGLIRNLSARPPKLHNEDVTKLNRIYWFDNNPESAAQVMSILRLRLRPSHFIAFMPEELEKKLYRLEKKYLEEHYPGRTEDDIERTKFQIRRAHGKYVPVMQELKVK